MLAEQGIAAYIQPVHDEWMGEYPPANNRRVEWLTDFTGSAGLVVVLMDKAAMFVDGRYTLQAQNQVSHDYEVFNSADITSQIWILQQVESGAKIGYDPKLYTKGMLEKYRSLSLVPIKNPIDELWENRPIAPATKIFVHEVKYSGELSQSKRERVAETIKKTGADAAFISVPESVNWLLNIRARDTENTPLCLAGAIIESDGGVNLYVDESRIDNELRKDLGEGVKILKPASLADSLREFEAKKMLVDGQAASVFILDLLKEAKVEVIEGQDPCTLFKAIKNPVEISGMRNAHIRDGAAVTKLLCWLEKQKNITELEVVDKLFALRKQNELFVEPSFDTISGSGAHGAIVHYRATPESNRTLQQGELFLLDSGGQYFDGTTDITRTIAIGTPKPEHKTSFTRVLKGHIALAMAKFPEGTAGSQLDVLARQYLWQEGLDYDHGTGHGVGCFSGVHEGPQSISKRAGGASLAAGMVLSNEPGYYKAGEYGIRIENLVVVVEKPSGENSRKFFAFETITCAPIDKNLIDFTMLSDIEKNWLTNYHDWVKTELAPLLDSEEQKWISHISS